MNSTASWALGGSISQEMFSKVYFLKPKELSLYLLGKYLTVWSVSLLSTAGQEIRVALEPAKAKEWVIG